MSEKSADHEVPRAVAGRRGLILAAAMMATFMTAVETTIVATAMPTIVADLGDFHLFSWVFAAYLLAQAVSIPIYGRLADLYGRKRIFFVGAGVFLVGSTLCGFAHGMLSLIAFRALQGIGAGAVQPVAYTIVGDIYSPTERAGSRASSRASSASPPSSGRRSAPSWSSMRTGRSSSGSTCRSVRSPSPCWQPSIMRRRIPGLPVSTTSPRSC
jgi:hypothetical protein